jgi:cytosine deaminase
MDLILHRACLPDRPGELFDIGFDNGMIAEISPSLRADAPTIDLNGRLVSPGFIETHIHLDKSCILDRCQAETGDLDEAIREVAAAKRGFTPEDVYRRAKRTLEKCILNGTTHMRTHLEVDPGIGLRGFEGVLQLVSDYSWAIDLEICIFPQEGLLNNPGTDELMVEALSRGGKVVGAAPYTDSNPKGQIDRVFELAREFDIDIDMHLDFGPDSDNLDLIYVCELTEKFAYGGRVTVGHVTKLAGAPDDRFAHAAKRMADAGVALTVLPSTDLYLMNRHLKINTPRGVTHVHKLTPKGVNCSLSTNNVLNPFTPFGDCSLIRMANLYANICQVGAKRDIRDCFDMITTRSARILRLQDYGLEVGKSADLVVLDCAEPESAVAELVQPLFAFKRGRQTFDRPAARILAPN